jgi:micrococcal nuclease
MLPRRHGLALLLLLPIPCLSSTFAGRVVRVLDGDTIEVLHNNKAERIRLSGIDCPEKRQAYGKHGKHAASSLAFGKLHIDCSVEEAMA